MSLPDLTPQRHAAAIPGIKLSHHVNINEGKTQAICFSRRLKVPDDILQLNGQDIDFVNNEHTYLGVTFDRRTT
jgi:hypothetical protein